ncbi:DUF2757 family protein [Shouchella lehensis]|nr:DUF2757 family protein [Shouchella lehensis]
MYTTDRIMSHSFDHTVNKNICLQGVVKMAVHYGCKYCQKQMATLEDQYTFDELGISKLGAVDQLESVRVTQEGDVHIAAICEDCYQAFQLNPLLHETQNVIH